MIGSEGESLHVFVVGTAACLRGADGEQPTTVEQANPKLQPESHPDKAALEPKPQAAGGATPAFTMAAGPELHVRVGVKGMPASYSEGVTVGDTSKDPLEKRFSVSGTSYSVVVKDHASRRASDRPSWDVFWYRGPPAKRDQLAHLIIKKPYEEQRFGCATNSNYKHTDNLWFQVGTKCEKTASQACPRVSAPTGVLDVLGSKDVGEMGVDILSQSKESVRSLPGSPFSGGTGSGGSTQVKVRRGRSPIKGELAPEVVGRFVRRHRGKIRSCSAAEKTRPAGRVVVAFTVSPKGGVSAVRVKGVGSKKFHSCLADTLRKATFPAAKEKTSVTYPLIFS